MATKKEGHPSKKQMLKYAGLEDKKRPQVDKKESRGHKLKSPKKHRYVDYDRGHKLKESRRKGTKLAFHDNDSRKKGKKGTKLSSRKNTRTYPNNTYEEGK